MMMMRGIAVCMSAMIAAALADDGPKVEYKPMKFGGSEEFGQASSLLLNTDQEFFLKTEWMDHFGSYFLQEATVDDRVDLAVGLGGVFEFPKAEIAQEKFGGSQYRLFFVGPAVAKATYKFGDPEHPYMTIGGGMFPYKYNPDAVNLGEYLFRSTPYPNTIATGGLNTVNDNAAYLEGFMGTWNAGNFHLDVLLPTQTSLPPYYDWSLAAIASYTPESKLFTLGAGVNFDRLLQVRPSRTSRRQLDNSYFTRNGKNYTGDTAYYGYAAAFYFSKQTAADSATAMTWKAQSDSVQSWVDSTGLVPGASYYTTAGILLMARGSLALGQLMNGEAFGLNDMKLYFEAAMLGVQNYPVFFDKPFDRVPIMVGLNLPTFHFFDLLAVQFEYYHNGFLNSTYSLGNSNTATPKIPDGTDHYYSQNDFMDLAKKDNRSWSLLAKKTFLKSFTVSTQVARDHLRTTATTWFPGAKFEPGEVLRTSSDWYWMLQLSWNI